MQNDGSEDVAVDDEDGLLKESQFRLLSRQQREGGRMKSGMTGVERTEPAMTVQCTKALGHVMGANGGRTNQHGAQ